MRGAREIVLFAQPFFSCILAFALHVKTMSIFMKNHLYMAPSTTTNYIIPPKLGQLIFFFSKFFSFCDKICSHYSIMRYINSTSASIFHKLQRRCKLHRKNYVGQTRPIKYLSNPD